MNDNNNKYNEYAKSEIREFFYNDIPKFPFKVCSQPTSILNVTNRRTMMQLCRKLRTIALYRCLEEFFLNISEDPYHENLNDFEREIVQSEGYKTFLYLHDLRYDILERNVRIHTWEYLRQRNYMTDDNVHEFGEVAFVPFFNEEEDDERFNILYGSRSSDARFYIAFIYYSKWHQVVVTRRSGKHLFLPLSQIMSYDYKDFDIHQSRRESLENHKIELPDNPETIKSLVSMIGLQGVILPVSVYESKTKC